MVYLLVKLHSHKEPHSIRSHCYIKEDHIIEIIYELNNTDMKIEGLDFMEEIIGLYLFESKKHRSGNYISGSKSICDKSFIRIVTSQRILKEKARKLIGDNGKLHRRLHGYIISRKKIDYDIQNTN